MNPRLRERERSLASSCIPNRSSAARFRGPPASRSSQGLQPPRGAPSGAHRACSAPQKALVPSADAVVVQTRRRSRGAARRSWHQNQRPVPTPFETQQLHNGIRMRVLWWYLCLHVRPPPPQSQYHAAQTWRHSDGTSVCSRRSAARATLRPLHWHYGGSGRLSVSLYHPLSFIVALNRTRSEEQDQSNGTWIAAPHPCLERRSRAPRTT